MSRLIQPRGLKYHDRTTIRKTTIVEAYTASWIEIVMSGDNFYSASVEAYTASWIEILTEDEYGKLVYGRGLYSLVD